MWSPSTCYLPVLVFCQYLSTLSSSTFYLLGHVICQYLPISPSVLPLHHILQAIFNCPVHLVIHQLSPTISQVYCDRSHSTCHKLLILTVFSQYPPLFANTSYLPVQCPNSQYPVISQYLISLRTWDLPVPHFFTYPSTYHYLPVLHCLLLPPATPSNPHYPILTILSHYLPVHTTISQYFSVSYYLQLLPLTPLFHTYHPIPVPTKLSPSTSLSPITSATPSNPHYSILTILSQYLPVSSSIYLYPATIFQYFTVSYYLLLLPVTPTIQSLPSYPNTSHYHNTSCYLPVPSAISPCLAKSHILPYLLLTCVIPPNPSHPVVGPW